MSGARGQTSVAHPRPVPKENDFGGFARSTAVVTMAVVTDSDSSDNGGSDNGGSDNYASD